MLLVDHSPAQAAGVALPRSRPEAQGISSKAILEKKLIHVSDASREKRIDQDFAKKFGLAEFTVVPLMVKDEVLGLVIADNHLTGKHIAAGDLRFLQLLLNQTGIAIEIPCYTTA